MLDGVVSVWVLWAAVLLQGCGLTFETNGFESVVRAIKELNPKRFQRGVKLMSTCTALPRPKGRHSREQQ